MKRAFFLFLFLVITFHLYAVNNLRISDIRSMGMGDNGVTQSYLYNPSLLGLMDTKFIHIEYFNRYGVKELGVVNAGFCWPNQWLSVGVNISSFGYDKYRESLLRLSLGKQLSDKWRVGISICYSLLQTELYEKSPQCLSTDVGILFQPVEKLFIGMLIMNYPSVMLTEKDIERKDFTDYSVQMGFQWEVINRVLIVGNMESNTDYSITGSIGIEYQPFDRFCLRAGMKATPLLPSIGVGYRFSRFTIDAVALYHSVLGISMGIGVMYSF